MDPEVIGPDGELIEIGDRTVAQTIADEELVRRVMDAEKRVGLMEGCAEATRRGTAPWFSNS